MKYAVYFHYEAKVVVDAEDPDEAYRFANEMRIDNEDIYYTDSYDIEEVE